MRNRLLTLTAIGLFSFVHACGDSGGGGRVGGAGGNQGAAGGTGGTRTGGAGGTRTGGTGGTRAGGAGGSAQGGTGGASEGGAGGSAQGGTGGASEGGAGGSAQGGTGGASEGGAGGSTQGGTGGSVAAGPVWDFESGPQGWVNGVDHFGGTTAQCDHGRLGIGAPMQVTDEKVHGNAAIRFDIDVAAARRDYDIICADHMNRNVNNSFAILAPLDPIQVALSRRGIRDGRLPAGSIITWNLKFSRPGVPFQAYVLGVGEGLGWQSAQGVTNGNWQQVQLATAPDKHFPNFGWAEIGILFNGPFANDFTGHVYLDAVDIEVAQ